jgi:hypothetical protein
MTGRIEVSFASFEAPEHATGRIEVSWASFETPEAGAARGGAWLETPQVETARRSKEKRQRDIWKSLERTIEEAYADAKGLPRKAVRPEVREALAPRDPARVQAIAAQLAQSGEPSAVRLVNEIEARLAELVAAALVYDRMEQQARVLWQRQEDEAIAVLLLAS